MSTSLKPKLFIGSSTEALSIAFAIQENLDHEAEVTVWTQGVFNLSATSLDSLLRAVETTDFGVFVFTPDDILRLRGKEHAVARDNVVFELGLFIGRLGRQRSFIIVPRDTAELHMPSDLAGLTPATYEANRSDRNVTAALGAACNQVRRAIQQLGPITGGPRIIRQEDAKSAVLAGMRSIAHHIARAMGPQGFAVAVSVERGGQIVTKSGAMIARGITASGFARHGAEQLRQVTQEMDDATGDGAKIAAVITSSLSDFAFTSVHSGLLPKQVVAGMEWAVKSAVDYIRSQSVPTSSKEHLAKVAVTAAGSVTIGNLVIEAMERVGKDGVVTVYESSVPGLALEVLEGATFDRGFASPRFVAELPAPRLEFEDCNIVLVADEIHDSTAFIRMLEVVVMTQRPVLVIAPDFHPNVITTLVVNASREVLRSVAVKAPGLDSSRRALLDDLAVLTGARVLGGDSEISLDRLSSDDLGRAKRVIVEAETTTLIEGAGNRQAIDKRIDFLRATVEKGSNDYEKEKLHERIARLAGGVANIRVGALTEADTLDLKYQIWSALHSSRKAIEEGVVPGGGRTYLSARSKIRPPADFDKARVAGVEAVLGALEAPIRAIVGTAKGDSDSVVAQLLTSDDAFLGFNATSVRIENLDAAGVLDPTAMVVRALETALAHARVVLNTDAWEPVADTS